MLAQFAKAFASGGTGSTKKKGTTSSPAVLKDDFYKVMQATEAWLKTSRPGDAHAYKPIFNMIMPHYPDSLKEPAPFSGVENEVALIVGAVTDMALEIGTLDPYAGAMAIRTWTDTLGTVTRHWRTNESTAGRRICQGIVQGINERAEPSFIPKDFAPRVQIINGLKEVAVAVYGAGSEEARTSDALWGSRLLSS